MNIKKIFTTKKGLCGLSAVIIAGAAAWWGITSFKRPDAYQLAIDNVAEARFYMKKAADNAMAAVQLYSGIREEDYQQDGIATAAAPFTVISVEPKNSALVADGKITADIIIDGAVPEQIVLEKNPYGINYAADLGRIIENTSAVQIAFKDPANTILELTDAMPEDAITWEKALEIATAELKGQIDTGIRMESYIKILCDNTTVSVPYWYVSFMMEDGSTLFAVISADGKVIGKSE
jgi:hypothetical protein